MIFNTGYYRAHKNAPCWWGDSVKEQKFPRTFDAFNVRPKSFQVVPIFCQDFPLQVERSRAWTVYFLQLRFP